MGSPPSKELLPHPVTGRALIVEALGKIPEGKDSALVISRAEKTELNRFLTENGIEHLILENPTREWPDTLLKSESYWADWNFVLLPDTEFAPKNILSEMMERAQTTSAKALFATFQVADLKTWGAVSTQKPWTLCEKPQEELPSYWQAWGLFAFHRSAGRTLLEKMLSSTLNHHKQRLDFDVEFLPLANFVDLTRSQEL